MKKWNFKAMGTPQEIIKKLESALKSLGGFTFNTGHDKNDTLIFKFHKPITYPDQILHRNRTIVNGKILKTDIENECKVAISFSQHLFMTLTVFSILLLGLVLIVLIPRISSGALMYLLEGMVIVLGIVLWIALQKKFERDIQKHKTLITELLEPNK